MYLLAVARTMAQVLLVVLLAPLFALALFVFEADGALLNSDFYKRRLLDANVYAFLLNDVAEAAIEEARDLPPPAGMTENPLNATGLSTEQIIDSLNRALPPGWLRAQTEYNLDQIVAFAAGDRDRFTARLNVSGRVPQIVEEGGALVESANLHAILFDSLATAELDKFHRAMTNAGLEMNRDRLERAVAAVFTEEWTSRQAAAIYYEAAPYLTGQTESFEARLRLDGLQPALIDELRILAREIDWRPILSRQAIDPMIRRGENRSVRLIQGLDLPQPKVIAILGDSITQQQYEAVADEAVAELAGYMFGDTEAPTVAIDLTDVKRQARPALVALARQTVNDAVNDLPTCAAGERWLPSARSFALAFPTCFPVEPKARSAVQKWLFDFDGGMDAHVESAVIARMPNLLTLTEVNFWTALDNSGNNSGANLTEESVAQIRELLSDGVVFTPDDLKSSLESGLGPDAVQSMEDARSFFQNGIELTEADLTTPPPDGGMAMDPAAVEASRSQLAALSLAKWMLTAAIAAVLMMFAALMPHRHRIVWTVGCMTFISAFVFLLFGPVYTLLLEPKIGSYLACDLAMFRPALPDDFTYTPILLCNKLGEIIADSVNAIMDGVALKATACMAVFGLLTLAALVWRRLHPATMR